MTLKNLKYSHKFTCQVLRSAEPVEEVVEELPPPPPPKPSLRRIHSTYEHTPVEPIEEIQENVAKTKRIVNRTPKQYEFQPTVDTTPVQPPKLSKAALKAEKYHTLASNALP
jgi:hypothetical protein